MSQTLAQTPNRSAKNLTAAFFAVADEIDETQRLPIILAAVGQIVSDAKMFTRPTEPAASRRLKAAKTSRTKKIDAKGAKPASIAAPAATPTPGTSPTNAVIAMPKSRRAPKAKTPMRRAAAIEAGNGVSAAA